MTKQILIAGATLAVFGGVCLVPARTAVATKYQPNTDTLDSPFVIRSVQPSTSKITVSYNGEKQGYQKLGLINIQAINFDVGATEDQIDENLPWLTKATPYWNKTIFYEQMYTSPKVADYGPEEKELTNSQIKRAINLDVEPAHILYYSVRPGKDTIDAEYLYGKIDYSLCMKSAVYKPGVECRAENKEAGGVWYWPYYNGVRLEVPESEWEAWGIKPKPKPEPEPTPEPTPTPVPTPTPTPASESQTASSSTPVAQTKYANTTSTIKSQEVAKQEPTPVDTAETQENPPTIAATQTQPDASDSEGNNNAASDFPWWLVIVAVLSLGIMGLSVYFYRRDKQQ